MNTSSTATALYRDEKGAMMVTGLFMSIFLIGTLWFLMGIGDALVFRDKMQEAVDSGAFASAALHAKGMNFLALMNLIMIVGTVIHLVLGVISDIKFAQAVQTTVSCLETGPFIPLCLPGVIAAVGDWISAYNRWTNYFDKMKKGFDLIHKAQKVAANAYPALGVAEAYQTGATYGNDKHAGPVRVVAVSTSIFPGAAVGALVSKLPKVGAVGDTMKKEALPVAAKSFAELCNTVPKFGTNAVLNIFGAGSMEGGSLGGRALQVFNSIVGTAIQVRYCNGGDVPGLDSLPFGDAVDKVFEIVAGALSGVPPFGPGFDKWWKEDGPFHIWGPAANGNDWMQTWAYNVSPTFKDTSESKVGLASKTFANYTREETPSAYFAQSEFYFNCKSKWSTPDCNFEQHAMYAINWRARLRHVKDIDVLAVILGTGFQMIGDFKAYGDFKKAIGTKLDDILGGGSLTKGGVASVIGQLEGFLKGLANGALPGTGNPPNVYH